MVDTRVSSSASELMESIRSVDVRGLDAGALDLGVPVKAKLLPLDVLSCCPPVTEKLLALGNHIQNLCLR
jgi:hypothetical protein